MSDYQQRFAAQLEAAVRRQHQRRQRRMTIASTALVAILIAGIAWVGVRGGTPAAAGVSVTKEDGTVFVRLADAEHRPDLIEEAARRSGLDVHVEAVPVGPSLVGRFVRSSATGAGAGQLKLLDQVSSSFSGFGLPIGWQGSLRLEVGEPARRGEQYSVPSDALAKGEPLACSDVLGSSAGGLRRSGRLAGLHVRWRVIAEGRSYILSSLSSARDKHLKVAAVAAVAADQIVVTVTPTRVLPVEGAAEPSPSGC